MPRSDDADDRPGRDDADERDRRHPPTRPGRSRWMDEEDARPRRRGSLLWLWALLGGLGTLLAVAAIAAALAVSAWAQARGPGPGPAGVQAATVPREEFEALVAGKRAEELLQAVGYPAESDTRGGGGTWTYRNVTHDPATGKPDATATLRFENSRVAGVDFP